MNNKYSLHELFRNLEEVTNFLLIKCNNETCCVKNRYGNREDWELQYKVLEDEHSISYVREADIILYSAETIRDMFANKNVVFMSNKPLCIQSPESLYMQDMVNVNNQLIKELENCMHYANPKNNNTCNFCLYDAGEGIDECKGKADNSYCFPKWRGLMFTEEDK